MNIYTLISPGSLAEEVDFLWAAVCRILNADPPIEPLFRWVSDETLSLIEVETAGLGPDRQTIYLSNEQPITRRILAHEMAHYIMVQTNQDGGEYVPQWLEEQLIAI